MEGLGVAQGVWLWVAVVGVALASVAIIAALTRTPPRYRRRLLVTVCFVAGLFYALEFFLPTREVVSENGMVTRQNFLTPFIPTLISPLAEVLAAFILGLGLFSLLRIHSGNVAKRKPGYYNSVALILSAVVMLVIGLWTNWTESPPDGIRATYGYLFNGLYQNMDAAMFSLIAFFILSAAYRAFRIRSIEGSILMASALIVLLGLSFGVIATQGLPATGMASNLRIETWSSWVLGVVSLPALRAIDFGVGLGALAMGLRIWLGIERGALFGD
ncbi:MAG TPA: hypothetical protein VLH79_14890 [Chthonomonadales bacterium]|nr:hypothetical protein [Chthonomonadales bacterium]